MLPARLPPNNQKRRLYTLPIPILCRQCLQMAVPIPKEMPHMSNGSPERNDKPQTQLDKFKEAAREHEADEDEARWDEKLAKIAKVKPKPEKPEKPE